jgi:hypothetical protein
MRFPAERSRQLALLSRVGWAALRRDNSTQLDATFRMALPIVLTAAARRDVRSAVRNFLRISPIKPPACLSDSQLKSMFLGTARSTTFRNVRKQGSRLT